jgi:hypothetical protein
MPVKTSLSMPRDVSVMKEAQEAVTEPPVTTQSRFCYTYSHSTHDSTLITSTTQVAQLGIHPKSASNGDTFLSTVLLYGPRVSTSRTPWLG